MNFRYEDGQTNGRYTQIVNTDHIHFVRRMAGKNKSNY